MAYEPLTPEQREELMRELKQVHESRWKLADRRAVIIEKLYIPPADRAGRHDYGRDPYPYSSYAEIGRELGYETNPSDRVRALLERRWRDR